MLSRWETIMPVLTLFQTDLHELQGTTLAYHGQLYYGKSGLSKEGA